MRSPNQKKSNPNGMQHESAIRKNFTDDGRTPWTLDQFHNAHIVFAEETD